MPFGIVGGLHMFIDAICINLEDPHEKAQQVANMHKIYEQAKKVLVWLGKSENNGDMAMRYIQSLEDELPDFPEILYELRTYKVCEELEDLLSKIALPLLESV